MRAAGGRLPRRRRRHASLDVVALLFRINDFLDDQSSAATPLCVTFVLRRFFDKVALLSSLFLLLIPLVSSSVVVLIAHLFHVSADLSGRDFDLVQFGTHALESFLQPLDHVEGFFGARILFFRDYLYIWLLVAAVAVRRRAERRS